MDPKAIAAALDALIAGDAEACMTILKGLVVAAASGDPDAATEDAPPPVGDNGADEMTESAVPPPPAAEDAPAKKADAVATSRIAKLAGKSSLSEALAEVEIWRASHVELSTERTRLAGERAALESAERRRLCVELVTLGAEFPSTMWADDKAKRLKARWESMPLAELRSHVTDQRAARGGRSAPRPVVASATAETKIFVVEGKHVELSARDLAFCKDANCDPETYATLKARGTVPGS